MASGNQIHQNRWFAESLMSGLTLELSRAAKRRRLE